LPEKNGFSTGLARGLRLGGADTAEAMKKLPPLHRGPVRRLSLAPLIICLGALALPAAWDLSQSRNPVRPTLSALHFGAMPSAGAACGAAGEDKTGNGTSRPTPICHPASPKAPAPSLPSINLGTLQRLFY